MKIPLCKPSISSNEINLVAKTLKSNWLTHGPYNYKFEELFNKKFNTKYSIAMNSCTSALECAIKSLGIKGEIIIPSFTWVSTANAVLNCGSKPVFADVDFNTRLRAAYPKGNLYSSPIYARCHCTGKWDV